MLQNRTLNDVIESVYEAALVPAGWNTALAKIQHLFDAEGAVLFFADGGIESLPIMTSTGIDQESVELYQSRYADTDPAVLATRYLPVGTLVDSSLLMSDSAWERTEMYNEVMRPGGRFHIFGSSLIREENASGTLGLHRSQRRGPFDATDRRLYDVVGSHLERAFRVHQRIQLSEGQARDLEETVDQLRVGVILVDAEGRILSLNQEARRIVSLRDGLSLEKGQLVTARLAQTSLLSAAIMANLGDPVEASDGALRLPRPSGKSSYEVLVSALPRKLAGKARAVVFITDPESSPRPPVEVLAMLYGLTTAEAAVCLQMMGGQDLQEIADGRDVSKSTVRKQVKTIFQKTDTRRQSELVRKLLLGPLGLVNDGSRPS